MNPSTPSRTRLVDCVVCGRGCIPMADYEQPTCPACDETMLLILVRGGMVDPLATFTPQLSGGSNVVPIGRAPRALKPCGTHAAFTRHRRRGEPIDTACDAGERRYQAARHAERTAAARRGDGACTVRIEDPA